MTGYETGLWYRHDGQNWVRANPPEYIALGVKPSVAARGKGSKVLFLGLLLSFVLGWVIGGFVFGGMLGASNDESLMFAIVIWVVGFIVSIVVAIRASRKA
jgi:hypothetical protein